MSILFVLRYQGPVKFRKTVKVTGRLFKVSTDNFLVSVSFSISLSLSLKGREGVMEKTRKNTTSGIFTVLVESQGRLRFRTSLSEEGEEEERVSSSVS